MCVIPSPRQPTTDDIYVVRCAFLIFNLHHTSASYTLFILNGKQLLALSHAFKVPFLAGRTNKWKFAIHSKLRRYDFLRIYQFSYLLWLPARF